MTSSHPSSGSENGSLKSIRMSDITEDPFAEDDPSPEDLAEPSPRRSLPPIVGKLYANAVVMPPQGRRRGLFDGEGGHAVKTGETSTSDRESFTGRAERRRPSPIPEEKPRRKRIRVAPLRLPLKRRLQTAAVLLHEFTIPLYVSLFWFTLAIPLTWPFLLPYLLYTLFSTSHYNGSSPHRRSNTLRRLPWWRLYTSYFPMSLHRTTPLDPSRNYILTYHPHGIISHGAFGHFCTEGTTGFESLFPGITNTLLTLDTNFRVPFYRDYLLAMGLASVSRRSCEALLRGTYTPPRTSLLRPWTWYRVLLRSSPPPPPPEGGRAITLVLGGALESLEAAPGRMSLIVKRRRGIIKIAIRENAALVPVLSFGENELYEQVFPERGGWGWSVQQWVKGAAGFTVPLAHARGVFNYDVGLMPYRKGVVSVVGRPVWPRCRMEEPREQDVEELQGRYIEEIQRLWERYKDMYARDREEGEEGELRFIG